MKARPELVRAKFIDFKHLEVFTTDRFNRTIEDKICSTFSDNLKDEWMNSLVDRFDFMGRARDYKRYRNVMEGGVLRTEKRWVRIKYKSIKRMVSKYKSSVTQHDYWNNLELPVNKVCRIIGVWRGQYPQKKFYPERREEHWIKWCLRRASEAFESLDEKKAYMVLPGIWQFNVQNLIDMATPNKSEYSYKQFMDVLKYRKDLDLCLPSIPEYNPDSIRQVRVNKSSFPGLNTSKLVGKRREISTPFTKPIAQEYARDVIMAPRHRYVVDTSLLHVGGREKRVNCNYGEAKEVKTRTTLSPEDVPTIIGQSVVVLINESLQKLAKGFNWGGRVNGRGQYMDLVEGLSVKNDSDCINANTDFSGHDNHVNEKEMVFGMAMLRCCFPEGDGIDRIFIYILSSLVCKRVVSPESNIVYEIWKGLPSGHTFTSILTTITAYLKIGVAVNEVYNYDPDKINKTFLQGAGDDWVCKFLKKDLSKISEHINKYSGATCDDFTINANDLTVDLEEGRPTFLKKAYKYGTIAWNRAELFINYAYPTSTKFKLDNFMENTMVHCVSGPFDIGLNTICANLMIVKWMERTMYGTGFKVKFPEGFEGWDEERLMNYVIDLAGFNFMTPINLNDAVFGVYTMMLGEVEIQQATTREPLRLWINEFNRRLRNSMRWMVSRRKINRFESVVRLKVFDTKKQWYPDRECTIRNFSYKFVYT